VSIETATGKRVKTRQIDRPDVTNKIPSVDRNWCALGRLPASTDGSWA
jgi:hypothetical protein